MPMDLTSEMNEQLQEDAITKAQEAIENIKNSYESPITDKKLPQFNNLT